MQQCYEIFLERDQFEDQYTALFKQHQQYSDNIGVLQQDRDRLQVNILILIIIVIIIITIIDPGPDPGDPEAESQ